VVKKGAAGNNDILHFIFFGVLRGSYKSRIQSFVHRPIQSTKLLTKLNAEYHGKKETSEAMMK
jgi:hypothetical protein